MSKKVIRLTEADLEKIVLEIINEESIDEQIISRRQNKDREKSLSTEDKSYNSFKNKINTYKNRVEGEKEKGYDVSKFNKLNLSLWAEGIYGISKNSREKTLTLVDGQNSKRAQKNYDYLVSKMDDTSKQVMNEIKEKLPSFYGYVIYRSHILISRMSGTKKSSQNVLVMKAGQKTATEEKPKQVEMPTIEFTDSGIPFDSKFESCSPQLKSEYVNTFKDSFSKALKSSLEAARQNNPSPDTISFPGVYYIKSIKVVASSSRVPHTKNCDAKYYINNDGNNEQGFLNLSTDRANSIKNLVTQYISDNSKFVKTAGGETLFDMTEVIGATGPEWDPTKGNTHEDYRKNQMAKVIITFMVVPKIVPPQSTPDEEPPTQGYKVTISGKGKKEWRIDLPRIRFPKRRIGRGTIVRPTGRTDSCPSF